MDLGLSGRKALITGASRGIGFEIAKTLIAEGAQVAICARNEEQLEVASEALGPQASVASVDVSDLEALTEWATKAGDGMGGIDIVVSNASALGGTPRSVDGWTKNFEVDVLSAVALVDAAMPFLEASDAGSIVQIGTITAIEYHGYPGGGFSYGAMKAALVNWISALSSELSPVGIRANTVSPGPCYIDDGSWGKIRRRMPEYYEENVAHQPSGRFGEPDEIARAAVFLASPAASWITGVNLVVDGGFTRRHAF